MKYVVGLILVAFLCLVACNEDVYPGNDQDSKSPSDEKVKIEGEGPLVTKEIDYSSFSSLTNIGEVTMSVTQADEQKVSIRAQQNILDVMTHNLSGNNLKIGVEDPYSISTQLGIFVDVATPADVEEINIIGLGDIYFSNGKQDKLTINIIGAGTVDALETEIRKCSINITGSGTCNVNITEFLDANIIGLGKVHYQGDPEVNRMIIGMGSVSAMQ